MGIYRRPTVRIDEIRDSLRTGDIYLGRGTASISRAIEFVTDSPWSHVGMIVMPADIGRSDLPAERPLLWEANVFDEAVPDYNREGDAQPKDGPMLVDLQTRVEDNVLTGHYEAMAVRYLRGRISEAAIAALRGYLARKDIRDAVFANFLDMIWHFIRERLFAQLPPVRTYYCSHLVTETYQTMGIVSDTLGPRSYLPRDYCTKGYAPFLHRLEPGREVYLWQDPALRGRGRS